MLHLFAGLLAYGPLFPSTGPGRQGATSTEPHTVYTWSHNWAAVVGIIICLCLLHVWFKYNLKWDKDDDSDDPTQL